MARYKVNTTDFYAANNRRCKRGKRVGQIFYAISWGWGILLLSCLIVTGVNQESDAIVGFGYLAMGIVNLCFAAFHIYALIKGWHKDYLYYQNRGKYSHSFINEEAEKNSKDEYYFLMIFAGIILLVFTVWLFVTGIGRLA